LVQSKVGLLDYYYKTLRQLRSGFDEVPEEPEHRSSRSLGIAWVGPDPWSQRPPLEGGILYAA
jgi:hypothetical protein